MSRSTLPRERSATDVAGAVAAGSAIRLEVFKNGLTTGRRFTSVIAAQNYANKIGGDIRPARR